MCSLSVWRLLWCFIESVSYYNVRLSVWFKGVYSTARVVAVRQLICGKRGRSLGTCRAEGAKYFLPIAWGGIIYAREWIASFRNLFVLRFIYLFMAYKHSRTVFLINIFSQADLKWMSVTRTLKLLQFSQYKFLKNVFDSIHRFILINFNYKTCKYKPKGKVQVNLKW